MEDFLFPPAFESLQRRLHEKSGIFVELVERYHSIRLELAAIRNELSRQPVEERELSSETRAIRDAEWDIRQRGDPAVLRTGSHAEWLDFEGDPELSARSTLGLYQKGLTSFSTKIRTHGLLHEEREVLFRGRRVPGFLLNLGLLGESHILVVPKLESRFEARALSELLHFWRARSGHNLRVGVEFETLRGVLEAEEILFELKDFVVLAGFDPLDYLSNWIRRSGVKLGSSLESRINPYQNQGSLDYLASVQKFLREISVRRGVTWVVHPSAVSLTEGANKDFIPEVPVFVSPSEEEIRTGIREAISYLVGVLESAEVGGGREGPSFSRFEFIRSVLWQWIHQECLSEEAYSRIRDQERSAFSRAYSEVAAQLLDSLVLNGNFVEFAGAHFDLHRRVRSAS